MAVVRFLSKIILQLLELSLVLRQDERILIDRGDLLVNSGEGLLRACLLLPQFAYELGASCGPRGRPLIAPTAHASFRGFSSPSNRARTRSAVSPPGLRVPFVLGPSPPVASAIPAGDRALPRGPQSPRPSPGYRFLQR